MSIELIENIINNIWVQRVFWSIIIIIVNTMIYAVFSRFVAAREKRNTKVFSDKKNRTFLKMLKSIFRYILLILTVLIILQIFGVDVSSMLAGVGIIGIIIGFAIQDALKDIIKGFDIISDNYYRVGDVIKYGDITGKVLAVGLKTTKVQDLATANTISIANRNIDQVEVVSENIYINIPLPYELSIKKAETVMKEIVSTIEKEPDIKEAKYLGLNDLADSSLKYLISIKCDPNQKLQIRRNALGIIVMALESHNISIPYTQLDLHSK